MFDDWKPYVSAAERRKQAERAMARLRKKGHPVAPVAVPGRAIAKTFWGKAWCENLERYSDYANRLPRGRTYVRNGSVVDLQLNAGQVTAAVSGSALYHVGVKVAPLSAAKWRGICQDCSGSIDSVVDLLQGRLSPGVMERVCRQQTGLFPSPGEIELSCSCPDWAAMCKHVAAVLYGIGARLDQQPELMFKLRGVDESDLISRAIQERSLATAPTSDKVLEGDDLAALFGLEMPGVDAAEPAAEVKAARKTTSRSEARSRTTEPERKRGAPSGEVAVGPQMPPPSTHKPPAPARTPAKKTTRNSADPSAVVSAPGARARTTRASDAQGRAEKAKAKAVAWILEAIETYGLTSQDLGLSEDAGRGAQPARRGKKAQDATEAEVRRSKGRP